MAALDNAKRFGSSRAGTRHAGTVAAALLLLLAVCAGLALSSSGRMLFHDGQNKDTECSNAYFGYRVYHGGPIYTRAGQPPYTPSAYGPLFYLSLGAVGWVARPATFQSFLVAARVFTLALFLLIALAAYRWARRWNVPRLVALAAPLLILGDQSIWPWQVAVRPEIGGLLLSLLGFSVLSQSDGPGTRRVATAGFLMGLAFLFKQTFLAAPAAAFIWLLWKRRYRPAALLAAAALAPVIVTVGWLQLRGEPVLYSLLILRHSIYDVRGEFGLIGLLIAGDPVILLQVGLAIAGLAALRRHRPAVARVAGLYLAFATLVAVVTMALVGATHYYLAETLTVCSFLAPLGLDRWLERLRGAATEMRLAAVLVLLGLPALGALTLAKTLTVPLPHWGKLCAAVAECRVLSDDSYTAACGKDPELIEASTMSFLERTGAWSPAPILRQIERREFDYVILRTERDASGQLRLRGPFRGLPLVSPKIVGAVTQRYRVVGPCVEGNAIIFVPNEEPRGSELARRLAPVCGWR
jgi:hypothetical protein